MSSRRTRRAVAVAGTAVLLLVLVTASCGGRGLPARTQANGVADQAAATAESVVAVTAPRASAPAASTWATDPLVGTESAAEKPQLTAGPLAMPDLTAIEQFLDDLDAALGADATADTEEGSTR